MRIARVVGNVVSTIKEETHCSYKLMIIEYLDQNGKVVFPFKNSVMEHVSKNNRYS